MKFDILNANEYKNHTVACVNNQWRIKKVLGISDGKGGYNLQYRWHLPVNKKQRFQIEQARNTNNYVIIGE